MKLGGWRPLVTKLTLEGFTIVRTKTATWITITKLETCVTLNLM